MFKAFNIGVKPFITIILLGFVFLNANAQSDIAFVDLDRENDAIAGPNIPIKSQFVSNPIVEPSISAHPSDNNTLLASAMIVTDEDRPYQSCRLSSFHSKDGGRTWIETTHNHWGYDPWTAILPDGKAAMSWLGTSGSFRHEFPLNVFTSNNSGKNWDSKVQVFNGLDHGHDGTKLVGFEDSFYLTTVRFNANMGADVVLYESMNGTSFKEVAKVDSKGRRLNFCEPAILTDGSVVVPTMHGGGKIWANLYDPKRKQLSETYIISDNPKLGRGYSRMAADTNANSKFTDRIYFVRAVADGTSSKGVWLNYSSDLGKTWSKECRVDLFDNGKLSKANVASVAVNNNGVVGISWVDGQHSADQRSYDVYFAISKDGGRSFQRPIRVTGVSSNPRTEKNADVANKFQPGGHYLGITTRVDGSFQLIWSDSRTGIFKLYTSRIEIE
jgi:hypothetical protein